MGRGPSNRSKELRKILGQKLQYHKVSGELVFGYFDSNNAFRTCAPSEGGHIRRDTLNREIGPNIGYYLAKDGSKFKINLKGLNLGALVA